MTSMMDQSAILQVVKKLKVMCDTPDGCITIQKDIGRLKKQANRNLLKFSKGNAKSHPWRTNPRTRMYRVRTDHSERSFAKGP